MFGTIRRHQNWLWIVIIVVIILSFVVFFSPDVSFTGNNRAVGDEFGSINGQPITLEQFRAASAETRLNYFFRSNGTWPGNEDSVQKNIERDTVFRVFLIQKLKELDVHVSPEAVARLARERLGNFPLASFEKEHLQPQGLTLQDFERFMGHEAGIQQLIGVAAASAKMFSPQEAELLYRKEHEEVATDLAIFSASNYVDKVTVTPEAVSTFYTNRMASYYIPERIQVAYVAFPATNFLAEADKRMAENTNFSAQLDEYYFKLGTNGYKDTNGLILPEAAAKAKIKEELRENFALTEARRKASEFGGELMSQTQPESVTKLENFAAAKNMPVKVTPPFDRVTGLDDTDFPPDFVQKAMALTPANPIAYSPIVGEKAVYIIALKKRIPRELQPLATIREKVTTDYKNARALEMAQQAGRVFGITLTNGLAQGKKFSELAAQQGVKTISLPPFSPSTTSLTNLDAKINLRTIQNEAFELKPGEASRFLSSQDGGMIVYLRSRLPFDEAKVKAELPEFLGRLRQYRQGENFNQWFRKQAEQAKLTLPSQKDSATPPAGGPTPGAAN